MLQPGAGDLVREAADLDPRTGGLGTGRVGLVDLAVAVVVHTVADGVPAHGRVVENRSVREHQDQVAAVAGGEGQVGETVADDDVDPGGGSETHDCGIAAFAVVVVTVVTRGGIAVAIAIVVDGANVRGAGADGHVGRTGDTVLASLDETVAADRGGRRGGATDVPLTVGVVAVGLAVAVVVDPVPATLHLR